MKFRILKSAFAGGAMQEQFGGKIVEKFIPPGKDEPVKSISGERTMYSLGGGAGCLFLSDKDVEPVALPIGQAD